MKRFIPLLSILFCAWNIHAQALDKSINKDSLLQSLLKGYPEERRRELLTEYDSSPEKEKEFFLYMLSMPRSTKKELVRNIDSNYRNVEKLGTTYSKLVPPGFTVSIEFHPLDKLWNITESIDICITRLHDNQTEVQQDWNLGYNSDKLTQMIKTIHWNMETLNIIKKLLADAHCVSIENGEMATIGFARSGMGKYFYKIFYRDMTPEHIRHFNDGRNYIFYKKNIVLEYDGGAAGPHGFPD
jgi:hypothetical protein